MSLMKKIEEKYRLRPPMQEVKEMVSTLKEDFDTVEAAKSQAAKLAGNGKPVVQLIKIENNIYGNIDINNYE